jgi:hypothetical protein
MTPDEQLDTILHDFMIMVEDIALNMVNGDYDKKVELPNGNTLKQALLAWRDAAVQAAQTDSLLVKANKLAGNEFAMGYDDSGCFWRFYYGNRGAGSMMDGWPKFESESAEPLEALQEFIAALNPQGGTK